MLPSCCWVKLLNGFHVEFYKRKLHPLKLVSILANVINFNPKIVMFITTSTILLNLFMELILSLTHRIYYYFYYLFISFHIESPLLIGVFLSFFLSFFLFSMILCLCGGLHSPLLKKFHPWNFGSCLGFTPNLTRHILISSLVFLFNHVSCVCVDLGTYKHLLALILVNGFLCCQPLWSHHYTVKN
jgi:hypothetical protein